MEQGSNDFLLGCCFYQNQRNTCTTGWGGGERESRKHTHGASCNTLSLPCLAYFQIISICERISPERHASKSFLCLRFIIARSKDIIQPFSLMRMRGERGWHLLHSHPKHMQKIILHLFLISLLYCSHHTEAQACVWTSQHPILPIWPRQGVFSAFLCALIRSQTQSWKVSS